MMLSYIIGIAFISNIILPFNNNIGVVNDSVGSIKSFDENLRVTGPHNSYLFFILKYGFIGFLLYISIFYKFINIFISNNLRDLFTNNIIFYIGAYLVLGLASDLLHKHSRFFLQGNIRWLTYLESHYTFLFNFIINEHKRSIKWLKWQNKMAKNIG